MGEITSSIHIDAAPENVFAKSSKIDGWPDTISGIKQVEILTEGPIGVGTRFRETRELYGREATEEMEITAFDAPNSYTLEAHNHGAHYITTFQFSPKAGGTEVTFRFQGIPTTFIAKILGAVMMPLMKRSLVKCVEDDLRDLKQSIESES